MLADLHTHSTCSDGTDSPRELVRSAAEAGVELIALTDHDTTEGWSEAAATAAEYDLALVGGMEVTCQRGTQGVHLLSYGHRSTHEGLTTTVAATKAARIHRVERMVESLQREVYLTLEDVQAHATPGVPMGRPHIADALVALGYAVDRSDAFARWIGDDSPHYVQHQAPDPVAACELIRAAGGVPVVAHAWTTSRSGRVPEPILIEMVEAGLWGVEQHHREHGVSEREAAGAFARQHGLERTGGSDYHGTGKPNRLGENVTAPEVVERLLDAAAEPLLAGVFRR